MKHYLLPLICACAATVQQMLKVGRQPLTLQLGYRYYAEGPSGAPEWGLRFTITFLFPN